MPLPCGAPRKHRSDTDLLHGSVLLLVIEINGPYQIQASKILLLHQKDKSRWGEQSLQLCDRKRKQDEKSHPTYSKTLNRLTSIGKDILKSIHIEIYRTFDMRDSLHRAAHGRPNYQIHLRWRHHQEGGKEKNSLDVQETKMLCLGIEPRTSAWKADILPLN
mmetsp:Transcript_9736/g.23574  ORF Transcript_9736/g.23574 Transcript_9736/m.23574 type:complete len:162 (+) Transcript_9736:195-680(+)